MKIDYKITTIILAVILVLWILWTSFGYGMMGYGMHSRLNVMMDRGSNSDCVAWANATDGGREAGSYNEHCNKVLSKGMHMMGNGQMMSSDGMMMDGVDAKNDTSSSMSNMMMDMTAGMKGKSGTELEKVFLKEMIVHHQGAVDMAKMLLTDKTIKPELRTFAEKIIAAQNPEIVQMTNWLKAY